jgi:starvation-inducible outer membrane lipoprotein
MRALLATAAAILLAGCASTPRIDMTKQFNHRDNTFSYVSKAPESEFVGTSAGAKRSTKAQPNWYKFGHP